MRREAIETIVAFVLLCASAFLPHHVGTLAAGDGAAFGGFGLLFYTIGKRHGRTSVNRCAVCRSTERQ